MSTEGAELWREGHNRERDAERQAELQNIANAGLSPEATQEAIRTVYAKDPSALKRHIENLLGRVAGKQPQPVPKAYPAQTATVQGAPLQVGDVTLPAPQSSVSYPGAKTQAERRSQLLSGGTTSQQRALELAAARQTARPVFKEYASPDGKQRNWFDVSQPENIPAGWQATGGTSGVPRVLPPLAMSAAKQMAGMGIQFLGADDQPIDVNQFDDALQIVPVVQGNTTTYRVTSQGQTHFTVGNEVYAIPRLNQTDLATMGTPLGQGRVPTERSSTTTDPFGVTSTTTSATTPVTAGAQGVGVSTPAPSATPQPLPKKGASAPQATAPAPKKSAAPPSAALDANGHIPGGTANPQLVQAANQLLDGMDIGKLQLPSRDKQAAAELASKYGWSQGTFTPKEKVLLNEAGTFINEASNNKALSVLDDPVSRAKLASLIGDVNKGGTWHNLLRVAVSQGATPPEMEFLRMYNQLVGTISGLGQLTRSGRITEATIGRLMQELPNPVTTQSAADAKARLQRLKNELAVAGQETSPAPKSKQQSSDPVDNFLRSFPSGDQPSQPR